MHRHCHNSKVDESFFITNDGEGGLHGVVTESKIDCLVKLNLKFNCELNDKHTAAKG